ncbi:patatin-like phospholipase domain-containing protein 2 [Eurytemora carolleeae]|uniref:patatin-like phospholipase domain-containing protein 2 n=1 Tax=Eurytemora carolleeae TaxID=1294199 RepID=UPI000C75EC17|nr:patatin-like phospholipase domain-containing protein 2 [Eurytemora carolleeae]|eukprot:XP_023342586.1 patatin-like phospholipase domain-containing protein 2 [Eurytemora affinis]
MNVSFAGCGFLGLYHVGVASCFKTYAPQLYLYNVSGASAGSIAALALLADVPLGEMTSNVLRVASEARARTLGPFSPSFNINQILYEGLNRILPEDIHTKVQGRLHISLTKVYDGSNILVNQFANKEEVIQVVLASTFIPLFSGWLPPRYRGVRVIDGGYSDNLPILNGQTITVSPFSGNSDICPLDDTAWKVFQVSVANTSIVVSKENLYRLGNVLLPPDPEVLARVCKQGFEDALRFLQKRCLISCTRCLTVNSNYKIEDDEEELDKEMGTCKNHDPNCLDCKLQREVAKDSSVPEHVWSVFENAITEAEAGFTGWIRMIPASKIIRWLTLPAALPLHYTGRIVNRLTSLLPRLAHDLKLYGAAENLIEQFCTYMTSSGYIYKPPHHHARFTCEFNITQYGDEDEVDLATEKEICRKESIKEMLSLELTAELEYIDLPHSQIIDIDLPHSQEEALRFQNENFNAAINSTSTAHSRCVSRVTSRGPSRVPSRSVSRAVSRMGSRSSSISNLTDLDDDSPALEHIRYVKQYQNAVMAFYYTDADNQVKVTEIFDVTSSDPNLLSDTPPLHSEVSSALSSLQRSRHESGRSRHSSGTSRQDSIKSVKSNRSVITTPLIGSTPLKQPAFRVGDDLDYNDYSTSSSLESSFSDPEADWKPETRSIIN